MTGDRWQVTVDTWHSVGWTCSQNCSSLALPIWHWQCLQYIWTKGSLGHSMIQLINHGGDRRTAPATPGLLTMCKVTTFREDWWVLQLSLHCYPVQCTALHCTALQCTALHCTSLHCRALQCPALSGVHCSGVKWAVQCNWPVITSANLYLKKSTSTTGPLPLSNCTSLHCTALPWIALYSLLLHCTVSTTLYFTALYCIKLHFTARLYIKLHFTALTALQPTRLY